MSWLVAAAFLGGTVLFGIGASSMHLPTLLLLVATIAIATAGPTPPAAKRVLTSLMLGQAFAWLTMPLAVSDFREFLRDDFPLYATLFQQHNPTGVPGCPVMALVGFPICGIGAHGGGGWRLGYHLPGDGLVHAANVLLCAAPAWLLLWWLPRRALGPAHWLAVSLIVPAHLVGYCRIAPWWD